MGPGELSRRIVVAQEKERRHLAAELHDRTGGDLVAVAINVDLIARDLPGNAPDGLASRVADVRALLGHTIASIRDICAELRPATLEYFGLYRALREYAEQFSRRTGIAVQVSGTGFRRHVDATESSLFRIAQEALTNCAKHARCTTVVIELNDGADHTILTISDNGVGFDAGALQQEEHRPGLGLLTMRERAECAGGKFSLESTPGNGTRITVEI